ncbi:hypothetical protein KUTeg_012932 [Tegillarca granosa]|uniref:ABC transporter domain-containing protein n=1 Tax=Tegillarca granosa TaxID=220873 RepID=A0ABQ9ES71_TEGGR|nr:hypothetical protein KUTeg_012932 [Tegillarca granosa]
MGDTTVNMTGGESEDLPTLNLLHVHYDVKEYIGPWYKGACLRHKSNKKILRDITAQFKAGEITALLGNSGSGKTSLLDVLSCRTNGGVSGKVYYNNQEISKKLIRQKAAYVMQADRLLSKLTVREILTYAAYLRLPGNNSKKDIKIKVQKVINDMGLNTVSDSRVGGLIIRGISGGERRRVTIAIQLLQDPKILLLDEPTTGLDCHTARHLISKLVEIAKRGKIVILTIHQPRSDIFRLFDNVGILSLGEMIYFGMSKDLVPYFTTLGYPCPQYANPLDHYVDLASIDRRGYEEQHNTMFRVHKLIDEYLDSPILQDINDKVMFETLKPRYSFSYRRLFVNLYRERQNWVFRILVAAAYVAVMVAFLLRLQDNQTSIQDRIGLYWQSVSVASFGSIIIAVPTFSNLPSIRDVFYREYRDGLYSIVTFIAAYIVHLIPVQIMSTLVLSAVGYW